MIGGVECGSDVADGLDVRVGQVVLDCPGQHVILVSMPWNDGGIDPGCLVGGGLDWLPGQRYRDLLFLVPLSKAFGGIESWHFGWIDEEDDSPDRPIGIGRDVALAGTICADLVPGQAMARKDCPAQRAGRRDASAESTGQQIGTVGKVVEWVGHRDRKQDILRHGVGLLLSDGFRNGD